VIVAAVVVVTVATAGTGGPAAASLGSAILAGMAGGATAGALGAALYGGSFSDVMAGAVKGAVIGGLSGAAFYGVGSLTAAGGAMNDAIGIAGHGIVGGATEAAQGGEFWHGFEIGALTKASSLAVPSFGDATLDTARAAAVGGTTAAIGGGEFANGAVTGAFSYALNDYLHSQPPVDPYSLDDAFSNSTQVNIGGSTGNGPKVYDVFGNPKLGFSTSCCGGGPGFGSDTVFGEVPFSPNLGVSCPWQLCSVSVGAAYVNGQATVTGSVRVLQFEGAYNASVNVPRLYQRVESAIYQWTGVPQY
jgi:hypothetical protein